MAYYLIFMPFYVLKLGGSLIDTSQDLVRSIVSLADEEDYSFLIVPGGGPFADLVRGVFTEKGLDQEAAHWMAVLAMEEYAYFLADGTGARLTPVIQFPYEHRVDILLPYLALQKEDFCPEHSWDFTSDSIALQVAARLNSPLIKATDVDGVIFEGKVARAISADQLLERESCIDQGSLRLLCGPFKGMKVWVLNGRDPDAFTRALKSGKGGTFINGQKLSPSH